MLNVNDIRNLLIEQISLNNIKETGYNCLNGNKYVELRNVVFGCTEDCIFANIPQLETATDEWYEENYTPLLYKDEQLERCWNKLVNNPNSRQAVIIISSTDNLQCTMYVDVSLIKHDYKYELEYVVHMRSNDSVEFRTDLKWHKKVYEYLFEKLSKYYVLERKNIIWFANSLQLYSQYFPKVMK